jgi:hypothetical protein
MFPWQEFVLCEEFVPAFPWDEFERKWLIENVKKAEKDLEDGKRKLDCWSNQKARSPS